MANRHIDTPLSIYARANTSEPSPSMTLREVHARIVSGSDGLAEASERAARAHAEHGHDSPQYRQAKTNLPAYIATGTLSPGRRMKRKDSDPADWQPARPVTQTGCVVLDIDGIESEEAASDLRDAASFWPYVVLAHLSPSRRGVKLVVAVDPVPDPMWVAANELGAVLTEDEDQHKQSYRSAKARVEADLGVKVDSLPDYARLTFAAHDPDAFLRYEHVEPIAWEPGARVMVTSPPPEAPVFTGETDPRRVEEWYQRTWRRYAHEMSRADQSPKDADKGRNTVLLQAAQTLHRAVHVGAIERERWERDIAAIAQRSSRHMEELPRVLEFARTSQLGTMPVPLKENANPFPYDQLSQMLESSGYMYVGQRFGGWHRWHEVYGWLAVSEDLMRHTVAAMARAQGHEHPSGQQVNETIGHAQRVHCFPADAIMKREDDPTWGGAWSIGSGERIDAVLFRDAAVYADGSVKPRTRDVFAPQGTWQYDWAGGPSGEPWRTRAFLEGAQDMGDGFPWDFQCRYIGAAMFGSGAHQTMLSLFGPGGGGKGTTSRLWIELLGGMKFVLSFASTEGLGRQFALERLRFARVILFPDLPADYADHTEGMHVLKAITGGDAVRGEIKRGPSFDLCYGGLVIGLSNFQPRFTRGLADAAAWKRRILPIKYGEAPETVVPELERGIVEAEGAELARWCVQSAIDANRDESWDELPEAVIELRDSLEAASASSATEFVLERYSPVHDAYTLHSSVTKALKAHNEGVTRRDELSMRAVSAALREMGGAKKRTATDYRWLGIADADGEGADGWVTKQEKMDEAPQD